MNRFKYEHEYYAKFIVKMAYIYNIMTWLIVGTTGKSQTSFTEQISTMFHPENISSPQTFSS